MFRCFAKLNRPTRGADGWVGFPFQFTKCDLGHEGSLNTHTHTHTHIYILIPIDDIRY